MIISLEEVKLYLRVDSDEENALITSLIKTAEEICEDILRFPLTDFTDLPEIVKHAILFAVGNMYEEREKLDMKIIQDVMIRLLLSYRKESW
ncbi:MAG: phage gp6-like head-tail connector protein [Firmicutes bacterium]|nr:phage gp6-like head-tail connector protein [Bacillota bacterium]